MEAERGVLKSGERGAAPAAAALLPLGQRLRCLQLRIRHCSRASEVRSAVDSRQAWELPSARRAARQLCGQTSSEEEEAGRRRGHSTVGQLAACAALSRRRA